MGVTPEDVDYYVRERERRIANARVPHAPFISGDDNLRIVSLNAAAGVTLTIVGRFLDESGEITPIRETQVPNTDRTAKTSDFRLGCGWLLELAVFASAGSPQVGQTFVRASLVRGLSGATQELSTLAQGFCTAAQRLAFPGSPVVSTTDRPGNLRAITGTNPAAGAEISEAVPTGAIWRLIAMVFTLVTDATVLDRIPSVTFDDGAAVYFRGVGAQSEAASRSDRWVAAAGLTPGNFSGTGLPLPLPLDARLRAGHRIRTATANLQPGDDYGPPVYYIEEWLEGA